jgi:hypothetical protein
VTATLTPWGRGQILTSFFMPDIYEQPLGLWLGYTRNLPVSNDDATTIDEPYNLDTDTVLGSYERIALGALDSSNWAFTGFAEIYNLGTYAGVTASAAWGLMQGWVILDSPTLGEGHVFAVGEIIEPFQITKDGDETPPIDVGGLSFGIYD